MLQDSSALLINTETHPRTLTLLRSMLADFRVGYGDKEMYWIASTASPEAFTFEPFLAGSLGDCGALVHFDPTTDNAGAYTTVHIHVYTHTYTHIHM